MEILDQLMNLSADTASDIPTQEATPEPASHDTEDSLFSFDGYQVVRGEFFAHVNEPAITFNRNKVYVNTACLRKLPDVDFVQILINPEKKMLVIRPVSEDAKDAHRWRSPKSGKPKQLSCSVFFAKVIALMSWNPDYRYKILGKVIRSGSEQLVLFSLNDAETYVREPQNNNSANPAKTPIYPAGWENQFGPLVEEHSKLLQIDIFDGYTVFGIEKPSPQKATLDNGGTPDDKYSDDSRPEQEPTAYS